MPTQGSTARLKTARDGQPTSDQTAQLVAWLDEEHRRDKVQIAEILEQLGQHHTQIAGSAKQLQDISERITRLHAQAQRYSQIEQTLSQIKFEVKAALDEYDQRRLQLEEDAFRIRQSEREREDQLLSALQMQIEALQSWQANVIGDHDSIARLEANLPGNIQTAIEQAEDHERRLLYVEDWISRSGQLTAELHQLSERLRQERAEAADSGRRAEQQRARHMAEWGEQIRAIQKEIDLPELQSQQAEARRRLGSLQEMEERLKQLESRLIQWQRLVDENKRKDRDQLLDDVEKRWQQQLGEWQFLRDEWSKKLGALVDRVSILEDWRADGITKMNELMERMDRERRERLIMISDLLKLETEMESQRSKLIADFSAQVESEKAIGKKRSPGSESTGRT